MPKLTIEEIHRRFASSTEFNEIFDAFEEAVNSNIDDLELYRLLFWNSSLSPDELCLFGEKLAKVFPHIEYDVYMWLAKVFEVTFAMYDNYELALVYFNKAAKTKPEVVDTYIAASDCYEPDLNIPPIDFLLEFVKRGLDYVKNPVQLYKRLADLYEKIGDIDECEYYRRLAEETGCGSPEE